MSAVDYQRYLRDEFEFEEHHPSRPAAVLAGD